MLLYKLHMFVYSCTAILYLTGAFPHADKGRAAVRAINFLIMALPGCLYPNTLGIRRGRMCAAFAERSFWLRLLAGRRGKQRRSRFSRSGREPG